MKTKPDDLNTELGRNKTELLNFLMFFQLQIARFQRDIILLLENIDNVEELELEKELDNKNNENVVKLFNYLNEAMIHLNSNIIKKIKFKKNK